MIQHILVYRPQDTDVGALKATETSLLKVYLCWRFKSCFNVYIILRQVAYFYTFNDFYAFFYSALDAYVNISIKTHFIKKKILFSVSVYW